MAKTNRDRINEGLEVLIKGLQPFIEREMGSVLGKEWKNTLSIKSLGEHQKINLDDPHVILMILWDQWNVVFKDTLGHAERSLVSELRDIRNRWAHMENFSSDDTYRALDSIGRLLTAVSAKEADDVEKKKMELLRLRFDEQRRTEARKAVIAPVEGTPASNLKSWREIVTPHPDVASGKYQQAEFAADLWQVYLREGSDEYKDPAEFFRRTFLTEGLRNLLANALLRLNGKGGDPVIELQTNFGGGKTHSILALYHLFSGVNPGELAGIEDLLKNSGAVLPNSVRRAVIVGTKISPGQPHKKSDGTVIRTMWGEIAWQLGGNDGYAIVKQADQTATNPGDALRELFNKYSPCLILIDEWVAYARQLHEDSTLPAGTFDTQFTFAQALTEAVKAAKNSLLIVSIPASETPGSQDGRPRISDIEIGGERGRAALSRLKNAIGRVEASWRPASQEEGFEIVRRRLFQPITDPALFTARDLVARAFVDMYGTQHQEFPSECREASYERRIKAAYPIHPEMFDRLYSDWSTLDKFQRTRGVLRLMASVIHALWERQDGNLLIMPSSVPVDDSRVQFELTRYLDDQWVPVIEKDVDGLHSLPLALDRDNPNLGRYSACRRVARTLYMGSAPTQRAANRGIDERQIKLGCVQPGESVATFGDALRRLTDRATYLYVDGKRYWYATQPTVTRLADDRSGQFDEADVFTEIQRRLREQSKIRGDFSRVHACASSGDIPDERETRLVIIPPELVHSAKDKSSPALRSAQEIISSRGTIPRTYKNTLVFLACDSTRLQDLELSVRQYLAWKSINDERSTLNLDPFQSRQAETKLKNANETVNTRIPEAYQWLLVPSQTDPKGRPEWVESRLQGSDDLAIRASRKLKNDEMLIIQLGGLRLKHELDRVPLWRGNHVAIKQLAEDFASYLYLPRVKDDQVIYTSISDGVNRQSWEKETFAYAEEWNETKQRYSGIVAGRATTISYGNQGLIIKPEIASTQIAQEKSVMENSEAYKSGLSVQVSDTVKIAETTTSEPSVPMAKPLLRRFHGSVKIDPIRAGRDTSRIAQEVLQSFIGLSDATVEVTLEIQATIPDGAPDKIVRDVTENCRTLKFETFGFEEE